MVPDWPDIAKDKSSNKSDVEFAEAFMAVDKMVVFSKSLEKAEGKNAEIIRANLRDEILKLKQQDGKYILTGGVDIPSQLIALGLVDEFRFAIYPVIAGKGRRLMESVNLPELAKLKLVESKVYESGTVLLRYLKG
ncbi:MAG: dihydrofolate reductase family protein [Mucilaginibacter sp.]